ncbi:MAG TPA: class I SAM-dependent methyltransferase, partial [Pyrinomonadaceae bacterium]|nr:class I SAM-dependent methyltransferase [Pyrinomonadaceae bacterium]
GLHDAAFRELEAHVSAPTTILDVGAGTGAWAARLLARDYHVTCLDRDADAFALDGVPFVRADLNGDFSALVNGEFAAVTAIEVIEHLENPTHFLGQCRKLLGAGGILLITTPNIECVAGRLRFLVDGHFRMFGQDERFNDPTHITPIQSYMFEKMSKAAGLRILSHTTSKAASKISGRLARALCSVISPLVRGIKTGDNHIYTLTT